MPGPWDGPVRVVQVDDGCLRLVTMQGHLEAGQVRFRALERSGVLVFEVEAWARCATPLVHLLYVRIRLAKEIQFDMWVRFCLSAVRASRGRLVDGVHVSTRYVAAEALPVLRSPRHERTGPPGREDAMSSEQRFGFRFVPSYRLPALLFGVTPRTTALVLTDEELRVRFGPWRLATPRSNIASVEESGGFQWLKPPVRRTCPWSTMASRSPPTGIARSASGSSSRSGPWIPPAT